MVAGDGTSQERLVASAGVPLLDHLGILWLYLGGRIAGDRTPTCSPGLTARQIASKLCIAHRTAEDYFKQL